MRPFDNKVRMFFKLLIKQKMLYYGDFISVKVFLYDFVKSASIMKKQYRFQVTHALTYSSYR